MSDTTTTKNSPAELGANFDTTHRDEPTDLELVARAVADAMLADDMPGAKKELGDAAAKGWSVSAIIAAAKAMIDRGLADAARERARAKAKGLRELESEGKR